MKFKLMMWVDEIGHRIHLPRWVICDRFERYINPHPSARPSLRSGPRSRDRKLAAERRRVVGTKFSDYLADSKAADTTEDAALRDAFAADFTTEAAEDTAPNSEKENPV